MLEFCFVKALTKFCNDCSCSPDIACQKVISTGFFISVTSAVEIHSVVPYRDLNSKGNMSIKLHMKCPFSILLIPLGRSRFLTRLIFLLLKGLPLTFALVHMIVVNSASVYI